MSDKNDIAQLKAELDELKASLAPTPNDEAAMRQWQSDMHNLRERQAAGFNPFSRADLEEMERAAPTNVVRDIAPRDARGPLTPCSPGAIPSSAPVSNVSRPVGTGWAREIPLSSPPGINYVDMLLRVDEAKKQGERMVEDVKRKPAESK